MGDLFTLPDTIDNQVSPLYQKKVRGRQAKKYNMEDALIEEARARVSSGGLEQQPVATPTAPTPKTRGLVADTAMGVVGGARDGVQEMANSLLSMRNWVASQMDSKLGTEYGQKEYIHELNTVDQQQRLPGQLVRGVTQFVTGFIPGAGTVGKVSKGAKALSLVPAFLKNSPKIATAAKAMASGAFADALAFDPHAKRLSNLIEEYPVLSNPVTQYLASKKDDTEAEGRFKNAMEGMGLGLAVDGLLHGVKYLRAKQAAKPEVANAFDEAIHAADEAATPHADPLVNKLQEENVFNSKIDNATTAARAEEQRLLEFTGGKQDLIEYKPNFNMMSEERGFQLVDRPSLIDEAIPPKTGSLGLPQDLSHLALHDHPKAPDVPRTSTIDSIILEGTDYRPKEVSGKVVEDAGMFPQLSQGRRDARRTAKTGLSTVDEEASAKLLQASNEGATVVNYAKSLGHDSLDSFLSSLRNTKGFVAKDLMQATAGGGAGALVGGKVDIDGDGEVTWQDVAAGFVMGSSLTMGGKALVKKLSEGKTKDAAFKELTQEKAAQLDTVINKVKGAMNSGTLDEKQVAKLQEHLDTLMKFKGEVKNLKHGTMVEAIKDGEVKVKYKGSEKPIVSFKENPEKLNSLYDAVMNGERSTVDEVLDVNWKYVDSDEEIQNIINLTSEKMGTPKDAVRHEAMVKEIADDLGFTTKTLETMRNAENGTANLDSKLYAIRGLLLKSAGELETKAMAALGNPLDGAAQLELRRQLTIHTGIQRSLSKTRTEVGRALRSFQIMSEPMANMKDLEAMVASLGGSAKNGQVANHVLALIKNGDQRGLNQYARAIDANPKLNAVIEYFINSLLSGPSTHLVNITTNLMTAAAMPSERLLAGALSMRKGQFSKNLKQTQAMMVGMTDGIMDAWSLAAKSWKTNDAILDPLTKIEGVHYNSISSEALDVAPESLIGKSIDFLGTIVRLPGRTLTASDEFFKAINYRMAMNEQIYLKAVTDMELKGLQGDELAKATAEYIQQMKNDVPESIMDVVKGDSYDSAMKDKALSTARYNTFTQNLNPGMQGMQRAINSYPLAKLIVPFFKVPVNILKYAHERTPVINLLSKEFKANLTSADPAVRELAQAKTAMGAMAYTTGATLASMGILTGRTTEIGKGLKDTSAHDIAGVPSYSIKLGDTWYSYNRLDPLGMMLGLAADASNILGKVEDAEASDLAVASFAAIANNVTSKSYLQGIANFMEVVNNPSEAKIRNYIGNFLSVGAPSLAFTAVKLTDPVAREASDLIDYFYKKTPGLSDTLPPVRNIFGEPVTLKPGYGMDAMSPIYTSKETDDPVKLEFMKQGVSSVNHLSGMKKINGVKLSPEQRERFIVLMGEPLKKSLDRIVASPRYQQLSDSSATDVPGGKAVAISEEITKYKSRAKVQLLKEYPELRDAVRFNSRLAKEVKKPNSSWLQQQAQ